MNNLKTAALITSVLICTKMFCMESTPIENNNTTETISKNLVALTLNNKKSNSITLRSQEGELIDLKREAAALIPIFPAASEVSDTNNGEDQIIAIPLAAHGLKNIVNLLNYLTEKKYALAEPIYTEILNYLQMRDQGWKDTLDYSTTSDFFGISLQDIVSKRQKEWLEVAEGFKKSKDLRHVFYFIANNPELIKNAMACEETLSHVAGIMDITSILYDADYQKIFVQIMAKKMLNNDEKQAREKIDKLFKTLQQLSNVQLLLIEFYNNCQLLYRKPEYRLRFPFVLEQLPLVVEKVKTVCGSDVADFFEKSFSLKHWDEPLRKNNDDIE